MPTYIVFVVVAVRIITVVIIINVVAGSGGGFGAHCGSSENGNHIVMLYLLKDITCSHAAFHATACPDILLRNNVAKKLHELFFQNVSPFETGGYK